MLFREGALFTLNLKKNNHIKGDLFKSSQTPNIGSFFHCELHANWCCECHCIAHWFFLNVIIVIARLSD